MDDFIFEVRTFRDGSGRTITRNQSIHGDRPKNLAEWIGHGQVALTVDRGGMTAQVQEPVSFAIEGADSVADAFARFDAASAKAGPSIEAGLRAKYAPKPGIVAAKEMPKKLVH